MLKIRIVPFILGLCLFSACNAAPQAEQEGGNVPHMMTLDSAAFENGKPIPSKYTCDGQDISPSLQIGGELPAGTQSLALIMDDPDAPMGTWDHWVMWNIPPATTQIPENSVPENAVLGENSFKRLPYGGPCPPSGKHRYYFKVFALDTQLDLPEGSTKGDLKKAIDGHVLDEAMLMGTYARTK